MSLTLDYKENALGEFQVSDSELEQLADAALLADLKAKEAAEEQKSAKEAFKKALEARGALGPNTRAVGHVRTIIKPSRRFSASLAKELLSEAEVEKYSVTTLDSALVKRNVAPDVYELMQADFGFSLEVKVDTEA